jgi:hypothetical protein
MADAG